jgi:hypothetical protein
MPASSTIRSLGLIVAVIVSLCVTYYFVGNSRLSSVNGAFGVEANSDLESALTAGLVFLTTLFGVLLGSLYRRLISMQQAGRKSVKFQVLLRTVLRSIDFQIGLIGAPVVFGLLWQAISDISLSGMLVIALQNGFTSHAILKELTPITNNEPTDGVT